MALDFSKTANSSLAKNRLKMASDNKNADIVVKVPLVKIKESPFNDGIPMEGIEDLAASMTKVGLLDPLVVYEETDGKYELVSGHRRLAAAAMLGWDSVSCVVRPMPEDTLIRFRQHADANVQTRAKSVRFWIAEIRHAKAILDKSGFEGTVEDQAREISGMLGSGASPAQVFRYSGIAKMHPDLLECDRYGVSAATLYTAVSLSADEQIQVAALCRDYIENTKEDTIPRSKFLEFIKRVRGEIVSSSDRNTSLGAKRPFYTRMCEMENAYISRLQNAKKKDDIVAALQLISQMRNSLDAVEKDLRSKK